VSRLKELKEELAKINKKKEDYVAEHPEHRKLVFKSRRQTDSALESELRPVPQSRRLFNKNGLPRHPERSIYYDPVMNPYGVPPPGMPYVERALRADEVDSDQDDKPADSDDDIVMPAGPPPGQSDEIEEDSEDDIPMPEGPPPPKLEELLVPPLPSSMPLPRSSTLAPIPGPPPGNPHLIAPPHMMPGPPPLPIYGIPPPPPPLLPSHVPPMPHLFNILPPPPPGFFPRNQSIAAMQDPLSSIPHQTFQAHRASLANVSSHPSLPSKPSQGSPPSAAVSSAAIISAAPELRDLKKESTAFVPSALKRKKAAAGTVVASKVNAAPSVGPTDEMDFVSTAPRPDLLGTLKGQLGTGTPTVPSSNRRKSKSGDDYAKFMDEMGDILG